MDFHENRFAGQGGVKIHWRRWTPSNQAPTAILLLVHGLGEHGGRYAHVARELTAIGCAVYAMDHRGHGKSEGPRAYVDRFAHVVEDIEQVRGLALDQYPGLPVMMLGHSMGGALALSYALRHPEALHALVLSGPAVALDGAPPIMKPIAKFLSVVAPRLGIFAVDPKLVSRDADEVERYVRDPLVMHAKVPARTLGEIVNFVEIVPALVPALKLPLLIQHGSQDQLAGIGGSEMVMRNCGSDDKTLKVYDGLYHEIYNEQSEDRAVVLKDLREWISAHLGGRRSAA